MEDLFDDLMDSNDYDDISKMFEKELYNFYELDDFLKLFNLHPDNNSYMREKTRFKKMSKDLKDSYVYVFRNKLGLHPSDEEAGNTHFEFVFLCIKKNGTVRTKKNIKVLITICKGWCVERFGTQNFGHCIIREYPLNENKEHLTFAIEYDPNGNYNLDTLIEYSNIICNNHIPDFFVDNIDGKLDREHYVDKYYIYDES